MPFDPRAALCGLLAGALLAGCAGGPEPEDGAAEAPATPEAAPDAEAAEDDGDTPTDGLGTSRDRIVAALTAQDLPAEAFSTMTTEDGREILIASFPETASRQVMWVGVFGAAASPHTVRVDYFPSNARSEEGPAVAAAVDRLLAALFPDWSEAPEWREAASERAWEETDRLAGAGEGLPSRLPVVHTEQDGVWLEALGARPEVVSYVITSEDDCRPSQIDGFYEGYTSCR